MKMNVSGFLLLSFGIFFLVSSCKKDTPDNPDDFLDSRGYLSLKINHMADDVPFAFNTDYVDDSGNVYQFTRASFYISQPTLDNAEYEGYALITPDVTSYFFSKVNSGNYGNFEFNVGVDPEANHSNPVNYEAGSPLAFQTPSTHWDWNMGYVFIILEGTYDSDGDGTTDQGFIMHVGTDTFLRSVSFPSKLSIIRKTNTELEITVNWNAFLDGVDLTVDNLTHSTNNVPLATTVADNVATAITIP